MSDGLTDAKRAHEACTNAELGLAQLVRGLNGMFDQVAGIPKEIVEDMRRSFAQFGLYIVDSHGWTKKQIADDRTREAIAFVPPHER